MHLLSPVFKQTSPLLALLCLFLLPLPSVQAQDPGQLFLQQRLEQLYFDGQQSPTAEPLYTAGFLLDLYRKNQFHPLWINPNNIEELQLAIIESAKEGLIPDDYHLKAINNLRSELKEKFSLNQSMELDVLLSDAMLLLGHHKLYGKVDPRKVEEKRNLAPPSPRTFPLDTYYLAIKTNTVGQVLQSFSPDHKTYADLKNALQKYKVIAGVGGWPQIPLGPSLKPGMHNERIAIMRKRLHVTGDLPVFATDDPTVFDNTLFKAVQAFQKRHHLEPDGLAGKNTLNAMNVTVTDRIHQIRVNLERTRWVVHDLPPTYIMVDIAGFMVQYYSNHTLQWNGKVMVGQPFHQTPVFRSAISYMVLNPTWTIPPSIVKNETIPQIIDDPGYLRTKNLRIFDRDGNQINPHSIPWHQYLGHYLPYTIRQDPGEENALGKIKFMFSNPYHVYLHDTPSKSLFGKTQRAFSHGCIRVQNPLDLARMLINNDMDNPVDAIKFDKILASGKTTSVFLKQRIPIFLMYLTAKVEDGTVLFKPDFYQRDQDLFKALNSMPTVLETPPPENTPESISPNLHQEAAKALKSGMLHATQNVTYEKNTL